LSDANNATWIGTADIEPSLLKDLPKTDRQFLAGQVSHLVWTRHDPNPIEFRLSSVYLLRTLSGIRTGHGSDTWTWCARRWCRPTRVAESSSAGVLFVFRRGGIYYGKGFPLDGGALQVSY